MQLRRQLGPPQAPPPRPWQLRWKSVCASSEPALDRWLRDVPPAADSLKLPRAVIAGRQRFGHGQQGRPWLSPAGGVWLSAALPWPAEAGAAAAPGLAVALGLALQLEARGLAVRIKWPNDLLLLGPGAAPRKLAGLLPRLRHRGSRVRWARVGLGLNGRNRVPAGAAGLRQQARLWHGDPQHLTALSLLALDWAIDHAHQPELVRRGAEQRLWLPPEPLWLDGEAWRPLGLAADGGLWIGSGGRRRLLQRSFG
jgi:BirA family biotin operon repressor/biotin-[acetyl-CoA-carboxylase] ligase